MMERLVADDGRVLAEWDPAEHPHWPPADRNGKIIMDVPWKFFDPPERLTAGESDTGLNLR